MDSDVAIVAGDEGLPMACGHLLHPGRDRLPSVVLEVLQMAHVVDLHAVMRAAELARVRQQAFEHFCPGVPDMPGMVIENCVVPPP
jgi:hypothetical protein